MPASVRMPSIALIVARSYPQNIIGCDNKLPWRLRTDLRFFKEVTEHHAIIMGRKTFDSLGQPLPNRMNIVMSRDEGNWATNLAWVKDRESALYFADYFSIMHERTQLVIVGGEQIYDIFEDLVNKIFLTEVFAKFDEGDAYFTRNLDLRKWKVCDEREYPKSDFDEYPFRITVFEQRLKTVRQRDISEFLSPDPHLAEWQTGRLDHRVREFERLPEEQFRLPLVAA